MLKAEQRVLKKKKKERKMREKWFPLGEDH